LLRDRKEPRAAELPTNKPTQAVPLRGSISLAFANIEQAAEEAAAKGVETRRERGGLKEAAARAAATRRREREENEELDF
jgi:hypothetical protein